MYGSHSENIFWKKTVVCYVINCELLTEQIEIPYLLTGFLSIPHNELSCSIHRSFERVFLDQVLGDCPPAIKNHLCQKQKLHLIPVFQQDPGDSIELQKYFIDLSRVDTRTSKYGGDVMRSMIYIPPAEDNKYLKLHHEADTGKRLLDLN